MLSYINYLLHSVKTPNIKDYLDMGFGIGARYERCKKFWGQHIRLCKEVQNEALLSISSQAEILVLGAGRLIDLDLRAIFKNSSSVTFVDIDPSCQKFWRKAVKENRFLGKFNSHIVDISGSIQSWTEEFSIFISRKPAKEKIAEFLGSLKTSPGFATKLENKKNSIVISQNLLGQLGVYWRDRVYDILDQAGYLIKNQEEPYTIEIRAGLEASVKALELQHLNSLIESSASKILLITDIFYYYYRNNEAHWQVEQALRVGDVVEMKSFFTNAGYLLKSKKSWLWHIAPQGIEQKEYGSIHEVHAFEFSTARNENIK